MLNFIKRNGRFILAFFIILAIYLFFGFSLNYGDPLANYGFSYAISKGEIPYRDFNLISTPLFAFYSSVGLHLFNNYLTFLLEQTIIVTITFYLLYKMFGKKSYLLLVTTIFFGYFAISPTYNYFCFFMMIILLYLEKYHSSKDYLIGFFIGTAICSKHTVGSFFLLPSIIFYYKDLKRLGKRFLGCIVPCLILLLYLLLNKALFNFIDLCILGLFDFSSNNGHVKTSYFYYSIICFIVSFIILLRHKKDINNYYLLFSIMFCVPLFDINHFGLYLNSIVIMLLPYVEIKYRFYKEFVLGLSFIIMILFFKVGCSFKIEFTRGFPRFEYNLHSSSKYRELSNKNSYLKKFSNPLLLSSYSMQYHIMSNEAISDYDVFLYGNYGYNGSLKLIERFNKIHNRYIVIDMKDYYNKSSHCQFNKKVASYIISHSEFVESKYNYNVYYKK